MSPVAPSDAPRSAASRNLRLGLICGAAFFGMVGVSFASVPLYRAFCQLTGFDGTVRRADVAPDRVLNKTLTIRFDANVRNLPWSFAPEQVSQEVKIGDTGLAFYKVTNNGKTPLTAQATYNVVPESAGFYFQKLECFCFTDQTIQPGETKEFPVVYFVDPKFAEDFETKGTPEVTLSYTFFPSTEGSAQAPLGGTGEARL